MTTDAGGTLDEPALEALYGRLERRLYNVLYRWVWNEAEASDLVQETFLRLWRMRDRVRMETVEALAFQIGVNLAANKRRAKLLWRFVPLDGLARRGEQEGVALGSERERKVREAIDKLPERLRSVVVLSELSEMSYAEIARVLGIPAGTVGSRRHKALQLLKERLGPLFDEERPSGDDEDSRQEDVDEAVA